MPFRLNPSGWLHGDRATSLSRVPPWLAMQSALSKDYAGRGIGLPEVVSEMAVSRRTLERRFLRATGRSVLTEINRCGLDRARRLLQETSLPVCRIATAAGFASPRMFNRIFRHVENLRPSSFRRQLQEDATANRQAA